MEPAVYPPTIDEILICVDSNQAGVFSGRLFFPGKEAEAFTCLSQCLLRINALLDENGQLQPYTVPRTFRKQLPDYLPTPASGLPAGNTATFHLRVLYRRNSSWQGKMTWLEKDLCHSFRSVLELMILIDSALRN